MLDRYDRSGHFGQGSQGIRMHRTGVWALALAVLWCLALPARAGNVTSVESLDISRYAGQWHEIARLPMSFQKKCARDILAQYTLREDGLIGVRNSCRTADGELEVVDGVARRVEGGPGRLEVRFAPDWLSWLPMLWADYWVIALDPDYQWAVVGEPGRDYLWILARTPDMPRAQFETIKRRVEDMGYALDPLIVSGTLR